MQYVLPYISKDVSINFFILFFYHLIHRKILHKIEWHFFYKGPIVIPHLFVVIQTLNLLAREEMPYKL